MKYVDYKIAYFITLTLRTSANLKLILRKWKVLLQNWPKTGVSDTSIHKSSGKWTDSFIDISQKKNLYGQQTQTKVQHDESNKDDTSPAASTMEGDRGLLDACFCGKNKSVPPF